MRWTARASLRSFRWRGAEKKLFLALIALETVLTKRQWPDLPPVYVLISIGSQVNPLSFSRPRRKKRQEPTKATEPGRRTRLFFFPPQGKDFEAHMEKSSQKQKGSN